MTADTICRCDRGDYDADPCDADGCLIAERLEVGGPGPLAAPEPERIEREDIPCDCWPTLRIERRNGYVHWSECPELQRQRRGCDWCDLRGLRTYHCPDHRGVTR